MLRKRILPWDDKFFLLRRMEIGNERKWLIIVDWHWIQVITSKDQCKILLIISCLYYWHLLKRYLFFKYFDGIVWNFVLKSEWLYVNIGDGEVVVGEQLVVSWHFGESQTNGRLCLVFQNDGIVSCCREMLVLVEVMTIRIPQISWTKKG